MRCDAYHAFSSISKPFTLERLGILYLNVAILFQVAEYIDPEEEWDDPTIRLYLDSADVTAWGKWAETGIIHGFTTNPTILKRDGVACTIHSMRSLTRHAFELGVNELQLQAWGATMQEIYSCALDLTELDPRVVVKIPLTLDGLKAAKRLSDDDVPFTITGVYSVHQVVTALSAGASYIAPYLGRMNDAGKDGVELISQMQSIVDMTTLHDGDCRLLVASLRSTEDIEALASEGCNTFTISPAIAQELVSEPLTLQAAEIFEQHAAEMGAKDK